MRRKFGALVLLGVIFLFLTWGATLSPIAPKIPMWVSLVAALCVIVVTGLLGSKITDEAKSMLRIFDAWRHNSPYAYSIKVRFDIPEKVSIRQVFTQVGKVLRDENASYTETFSNSNNMMIQLNEPPVTIRVRVTPSGDEVDDWSGEESKNVVEISCADIQVIGFKDRSSQRVLKIVNMLHDIGKSISSNFAGDSPEILMNISRLQNIDSARRTVAPHRIINQMIDNGTKVIRAENAIQIVSKNRNSIVDELRGDISFLEPLA